MLASPIINNTTFANKISNFQIIIYKLLNHLSTNAKEMLY